MSGSLDTPIAGTDDHITTLVRTKDVATSLAAKAKALRITDVATRAAAADLRARITSGIKQVEDARTQIVKPLNDHVANINARFRPMRDGLEAARGLVDAEILRDRREQERIAEESRRRAAQEAAAAQAKTEAEQRARAVEAAVTTAREAQAAGYSAEDADELAALVAQDELAKPVEVATVAPVIAPPAKTTAGERGTTTVAKVWTFEVASPEVIPRAFLVLDEGKVRQAIREGVRVIDGLRIYQADVVRGR